MGLLERIRNGTYQPDREVLVVPGRLVSLTEAATRIGAGEHPLAAVRDFLGHVGNRSGDELSALVSAPPEPTGSERADALLGGIAEYLAVTRDFPCPAWTQEPGRFLDRFWFVSEVAGFRAVAIAQTPVSLKRRAIFWPERSLRRV